MTIFNWRSQVRLDHQQPPVLVQRQLSRVDVVRWEMSTQRVPMPTQPTLMKPLSKPQIQNAADRLEASIESESMMGPETLASETEHKQVLRTALDFNIDHLLPSDLLFENESFFKLDRPFKLDLLLKSEKVESSFQPLLFEPGTLFEMNSAFESGDMDLNALSDLQPQEINEEIAKLDE